MVIPSFYGRAWLYLVPFIPSVLVTIFNLYHLLTNRVLRKTINNHVIILILSSGLIEMLTDITFSIQVFFNGTVLLPTRTFCFAWTFISSVSLASNFILMAWASVERHIIIFHSNLLATKSKRLFFHYIPLVTAILWPTMFYFIIYFVIPCNYSFNYNKRQCLASGCLASISWAVPIDSFAHNIIPALVTVTFSVALFARVLYKRYRARGRIDWGNYKKMAGQLLSISALYFCLQLPPMIMYAAYSFGLPRTVASDYFNSGTFFMYWVVLFTPFASVLALPELGAKLKDLLFWRRRRAVQPEMMEMTRRNVGRAVAMVPGVQPKTMKMTRRNVDQTVAVVPVVQPKIMEITRRNVVQTVEALPVAQTVEVLPVVQTVEALPVVLTVEALPVAQTVEALPVVQTVEALPVIRTVEPLPPVVI
jgi:hypothetical protein